jgi:NADH-quinone oxidoreductase subunit C
MGEELQAKIEAIAGRFGLKSKLFRDQYSLIVPVEKIVEVLRALRDEYNFEMLVGQSAVDYWPQQEPRFHVIYQLLSLSRKERLGLRVPVSGISPSIPTVEKVFKNANWFEREIWDMFGIHVEGHSDLRRLVMPHDWQGHPLRKDYPLGYEEVQFTFNFDEIDLRKPYAKE